MTQIFTGVWTINCNISYHLTKCRCPKKCCLSSCFLFVHWPSNPNTNPNPDTKYLVCFFSIRSSEADSKYLIYKLNALCWNEINLIITLTLTVSLSCLWVHLSQIRSFLLSSILADRSLFSSSVSVSTTNCLPSTVRVWGDSGLAVRNNPSVVGHPALLPSCHHTGGSLGEV